MNWKGLLRTIAHSAVSAAVVTAAATIQSGAPITSDNVLVPAGAAAILGALHAIAPSSIGLGPKNGPQ